MKSVTQTDRQLVESRNLVILESHEMKNATFTYLCAKSTTPMFLRPSVYQACEATTHADMSVTLLVTLVDSVGDIG